MLAAPQMMTWLSRRESCRASSKPMPLAPPVMSTVLPANFIVCGSPRHRW